MTNATLRIASLFLISVVVGCSRPQADRTQTIDGFMSIFGTAMAEYDPKMVEELLLPPDDTKEGKIRATYIPEMQKAIAYMKRRGTHGQKYTVSFKDTEISTNGPVTTILTTTVAALTDGKIEEGRFCLNVTLTDEGWKIVTWSLPDGA